MDNANNLSMPELTDIEEVLVQALKWIPRLKLLPVAHEIWKIMQTNPGWYNLREDEREVLFSKYNSECVSNSRSTKTKQLTYLNYYRTTYQHETGSSHIHFGFGTEANQRILFGIEETTNSPVFIEIFDKSTSLRIIVLTECLGGAIRFNTNSRDYAFNIVDITEDSHSGYASLRNTARASYLVPFIKALDTIVYQITGVIPIADKDSYVN